jgi:hypothetical protein
MLVQDGFLYLIETRHKLTVCDHRRLSSPLSDEKIFRLGLRLELEKSASSGSTQGRESPHSLQCHISTVNFYKKFFHETNYWVSAKLTHLLITSTVTYAAILSHNS